jgi:hypothetical protein
LLLAGERRDVARRVATMHRAARHVQFGKFSVG